MALLAYDECNVGDGRLVVDGKHVDCSGIFGRSVLFRTVADNLVLERCVAVAEIVCSGLVGEFAQIGYSNHLAFGNGRSIVCKRSDGREPRDDNGGERLRFVLEVEFRSGERMLFIFVDVDDELLGNAGLFVDIGNEDIEAAFRIVIVVSGEFCSRNVANYEPKFFAVCGAVFDKTVD